LLVETALDWERRNRRCLPESGEIDAKENMTTDNRRQFVSFSFYRVLPEWRRLPLSEREEHRREFADSLNKWCVPDTMGVLTYSLVGTRADADIMLWRICYSLECLQECSSDVLHTKLGGYLRQTHSFLSMTRHSLYQISEDHPHFRGIIKPGDHKYLLVYPLVRTRAWYQLPFEERQRMVNEITKIMRDFPRSQFHVSYSFGLDEQDFVIAIESDHPEDYVEELLRMREAEASAFVQRDHPVFTCVRTDVQEMVEKIG
jgi:chlorite dismutase